MSFLNPLPVSVVLAPVDGGLVTIRRGVEPHRGKLALPGGYINLGESWEAAGARELFEETGIIVNPSEIIEFGARNGTDGVIVIFGLAPAISPACMPPFQANEEATERVVIFDVIDLAFPLHTEIVRSFFTKGRAMQNGITV